jgi:hypothetical protein
MKERRRDARLSHRHPPLGPHQLEADGHRPLQFTWVGHPPPLRPTPWRATVRTPPGRLVDGHQVYDRLIRAVLDSSNSQPVKAAG